MQEELTALEPELKRKSKETEGLMQRLAVDQEQANEVRTIASSFTYYYEPPWMLVYPIKLRSMCAW